MNYFSNCLIKFKNHRRWYQFIKKNRNMFPSETYLKYPGDSTFDGKSVLNIGCGRSVFRSHNVVNVDAVEGEGVNVVWDLSKTPLPFESNSFDLIIANHVLEHIPGWFECFKELARLVKPGGRIEVWVPPVSSDSAFTYRDHINWIGQASFVGCGAGHRAGVNLAAQKELDTLGDCRKLILQCHEVRPISTWWTILAPNWIMDWMIMHLRNIVSEEGFIFTKQGDVQ